MALVGLETCAFNALHFGPLGTGSLSAGKDEAGLQPAGEFMRGRYPRLRRRLRRWAGMNDAFSVYDRGR
ncbi:MAG: hypothetical protein ACREP9_23025 [Candidatus Dormibacteraceae bacterium]